MKKQTIIITSISIILLFGLSPNIYGQVKGADDNTLIQGKWKDEKDEKSIWEFRSDGKLYSTYEGFDEVDVYTYNITSTPPICPDAKLSNEQNIKYLKLVDQQDGDISCFYIYSLNENRLTVMDAVTGHIFPSIRIEE